MDLPWGDERTDQFVTNVGVITSHGPHGDNVMACEWTHHVSYSPGLIAVCVRQGDATCENIHATKEFGVNLCSDKQSVLSSVSGGSSGRAVNKVKVLEGLGFIFYRAKKIKTLMIEGAVLSAEFKLVREISIGDHTMFIGEVVEAKADASKNPLVYHKRKYWKMGEHIDKPPQEELEKIKKLVEDNKK